MAEKKNRRLLQISAIQTAGNAVVLFAACFLNVRAAVALKKTYSSYGGELPFLTKLLFMHPPAFYVAAFTLLIIALVIKEVFIENKATTIFINSMLTFSLFAVLAVYCAAAFLPLYSGGLYG